GSPSNGQEGAPISETLLAPSPPGVEVGVAAEGSRDVADMWRFLDDFRLHGDRARAVDPSGYNRGLEHGQRVPDAAAAHRRSGLLEPISELRHDGRSSFTADLSPLEYEFPGAASAGDKAVAPDAPPPTFVTGARTVGPPDPGSPPYPELADAFHVGRSDGEIAACRPQMPSLAAGGPPASTAPSDAIRLSCHGLPLGRPALLDLFDFDRGTLLLGAAPLGPQSGRRRGGESVTAVRPSGRLPAGAPFLRRPACAEVVDGHGGRFRPAQRFGRCAGFTDRGRFLRPASRAAPAVQRQLKRHKSVRRSGQYAPKRGPVRPVQRALGGADHKPVSSAWGSGEGPEEAGALQDGALQVVRRDGNVPVRWALRAKFLVLYFYFTPLSLRGPFRRRRYGAKCQFAHGNEELRTVERHPKHKSVMCKTFWEKGSCPYGQRCCFIHTAVPSEHGTVSIQSRAVQSAVSALSGSVSTVSVKSPMTPKDASGTAASYPGFRACAVSAATLILTRQLVSSSQKARLRVLRFQPLRRRKRRGQQNDKRPRGGSNEGRDAVEPDVAHETGEGGGRPRTGPDSTPGAARDARRLRHRLRPPRYLPAPIAQVGLRRRRLLRLRQLRSVLVRRGFPGAGGRRRGGLPAACAVRVRGTQQDGERELRAGVPPRRADSPPAARQPKAAAKPGKDRAQGLPCGGRCQAPLGVPEH
ncbi:MAG: hypothetical protein BJ554DRAFT_2211, partial [Olpidium bornovanus]